MDAEGTVSLGADMVPETGPVAPRIDHMKLAYDMYTSADWYKIIMENCNDY